LKGGAAGLLLRGLASGLPPAWLARPAFAQDAEPPQTLILSVRSAGDPVNANCPGSYVPGVAHNPAATMAARDLRLGDVATRAAAPWADLPEALRSRMAFFHHASRAAAHPEQAKVLTMHSAVRALGVSAPEQLPAAVAQMTAGSIGTLQLEPVPVAKSVLSIAGQPLQTVGPEALRTLFDGTDGDLADLRDLRDNTLDTIYAGLRESGTRSQKAFLERYAASRGQARALGENLGALLEGIPSDDPVADQVRAAVALARLRVAPVISISLGFGGDNHNDAELTEEADQTVLGVGHIGLLWSELQAAGLQDAVTFALLNVFGRTLARNSQGGRNHNRHHGVMVAFGKGIRGGVIGGPGEDLRARGVDPVSGAPVADGGIPADATLEAAGRSLLSALGIPDEVAEERLRGGQVVQTFLA